MIYILGSIYGTTKKSITKIGNIKFVYGNADTIENIVNEYTNKENNGGVIGLYNNGKCYIQANLFYNISNKSLINALSQFLILNNIETIVNEDIDDNEFKKYYVIIDLNSLITEGN